MDFIHIYIYFKEILLYHTQIYIIQPNCISVYRWMNYDRWDLFFHKQNYPISQRMSLIPIGYYQGYLKKRDYSKNIERIRSNGSILAIIVNKISGIEFVKVKFQFFSKNWEEDAKSGRIISLLFVFIRNTLWCLILDLPWCIFNDT